MSQQSLTYQKDEASFCPCFSNLQSNQQGSDFSEQLMIRRMGKKKPNFVSPHHGIKTIKKSQKHKETAELTNLSPIEKVKNHLRTYTPYQEYNQLFLCERLKHAFTVQAEAKPFSLGSSFSGKFAEL